MKYTQIGDQHYLYTDKEGRFWEVWRQATHGSDQWAIKCKDRALKYFDDAFWTRTSAVKQIHYLSDPINLLHELEMKKREEAKKEISQIANINYPPYEWTEDVEETDD